MNRKSILRSILPIALVAMSAPVFADEVSENLIINGQVLPGCQLQISPLDNLDINSLSLSQVASSPTGIGARCNTGTAYEIAPGDGLNYGLNADFPNHRSLSGPGFFLAYSLHRDMVGGETWGTGADQISGVGNGEWQFMPYSIAFLGANKAPNGFYSDTVQVTLTYN
ncbi:MAG: spore coat U domain-containing protein [Pseudoxanthomonas sp.]|nr:spore coat U domain-containing protein [Luteimonas aestuarii]MCR6627222.1 spore coat U domain-containing protein [Pseudoxanthomonas sp.]